MNTMLPLRILAIGSSVFFLIYGLLLQLWPLVGMEATLLPINVYRLWQLLSLRRRVNAALTGGPPDFSIVKRYGRRRALAAGERVFARGEAADRIYLVDAGRVRIEDVGVEVAAGEVFGEIAFFTADATRTATATSAGETVVYELDKTRFMRLQFEDPGFGLAIMQLVTERLIANGARGAPRRGAAVRGA